MKGKMSLLQKKEKYYAETADKNLFWGNAFNPRDQNLLFKKMAHS
jgi:hypothetical protein